jgi:UPF0755 protein
VSESRPENGSPDDSDDAWDAIFRTPPVDEPTSPGSGSEPVAGPPASRRAARSSATRGSARPGRSERPVKRRRRWPWVLLAVFLLMLGGAGAAAYWAWSNYEPQIRSLLGIELPNDYEGTGNGTEVMFAIQPGDIGSSIASNLVDAGVTMTFDAFYDLLLADPSIQFQPGTYPLQEQMSAQAALDVLRDPANIITIRALVREGLRAGEVIAALSEATGVPIEDYEAVIADPQALGLPDEAPNIEGYLFPATYTFEPGGTAFDHIQRLVTETFARLDARGVAVEDRHEVLTIASLIQREARLEEDFFRVSRVIQNRLEIDMLLQFDSATQYGAGDTGSVWSSADALAADNPYNTYAIVGLPIGPIAAPGDLAIDAALNPVEGDWIYFVTINLATGETQFSVTLAEHEQGVERLRAWCRESDENAQFCA